MIWRWTAAAVAAIAVMGGVGARSALERLEPVAPEKLEEIQSFSVERGQGLGHVARRLEDARLIRDATALKVLARLRGDEGRLMAGEYDLSPSWSSKTILDRIISGRVKTYEIVIPEGTRATEIAVRLADAGLADAEEFLEVVEDAEFAASLGVPAASLEGYLYPETYHMPRDLSTREIAQIMVAQFDRVWSEIEAEAALQSLGKHEIVTLASIVEKETAAPEERPVIAAVFHNRIEKRMRLETDPTVIYGIENFDGNITRKHLRDSSNPYNTYRIPGLPPGPIASPGIDALRATIQPAETDYLYFVSRNDGTHEFSHLYKEHVNAVRRYQLRRRNR